MNPESIGMLVPLTFLLMLAIERIAPARSYPQRRGWVWTGLGFLMLMGVISTLAPFALEQLGGAQWRLLDLRGLPLLPAVLLGWVTLSLAMYCWHRCLHASPLLWRTFHQLHHSPQRVDIAGSIFFHPNEMIAHNLLHLGVTVWLLGLDPLASAITGYIAAFHGMFQHMNIATPSWVGWFIQRPEAHNEHHRMGMHGFNYGDFPLWDMLAGSFRNPAQFTGRVGFESPGDLHTAAMLACRDVQGASVD